MSAAVDLRRAGLQQAVPIDLLRELHEHYLPAAVRSEPWEEALRWATQPLHSTSSLLVPVGDDHYQAFDYLPDAYDDALGWPAVRDEIWQALTSFVPPPDAITIAWAAFHRHELGVAEAALGRALEAGHIEAALDFAFMMRDMGRSEEVTGWLSRAVSGAREAGATAEVTVGLKYRLAWWAGERVRGAGDPARALELAREAEAESVRLLGPEHVLTLWCRLTAVRQVGALGRAEEARRLAEEIVDMGTRLFGHDHEVVSSARFEVAVWTVDGGDPRRGIALWQELVVDDLLVAGELGDSLANIEGVMDDVADPALTAELTGWLAALAGRDDITGTIDDVTAMRLHGTVAWWTGGREQGLGDHRLARDMAEQLVEAGRGILSAGDKEVLRVEAVLGHQLGRMGDPVAARRLCARVHEDAVRIYGERSTIADFTGNLAEIWTLAD
ncbi:hypothetical protein Hesp01_22970 [Herbidospora sp. NBRC 101105]|nr:hypothetical protein Hesp01_22970 [Herbidospora sp. NBRC 101105]